MGGYPCPGWWGEVGKDGGKGESTCPDWGGGRDALSWLGVRGREGIPVLAQGGGRERREGTAVLAS